ncbi:MAG: hypothetical protein J3R72DRAFT_458834 [Linnemannia gamsii]|nr:MAG: hypothetical protein J3R72DRAFT_458834 [Linnemannia gamsii]
MFGAETQTRTKKELTNTSFISLTIYCALLPAVSLAKKSNHSHDNPEHFSLWPFVRSWLSYMHAALPLCLSTLTSTCIVLVHSHFITFFYLSASPSPHSFSRKKYLSTFLLGPTGLPLTLLPTHNLTLPYRIS